MVKRVNHSFKMKVETLAQGEHYASLCGEWFIADRKLTKRERDEKLDCTLSVPLCPKCERIKVAEKIKAMRVH